MDLPLSAWTATFPCVTFSVKQSRAGKRKNMQSYCELGLLCNTDIRYMYPSLMLSIQFDSALFILSRSLFVLDWISNILIIPLSFKKWFLNIMKFSSIPLLTTAIIHVVAWGSITIKHHLLGKRRPNGWARVIDCNRFYVRTITLILNLQSPVKAKLFSLR